MTHGNENQDEKPRESESAELGQEGMEEVVGGIVASTPPKLTQTTLSASSLAAKVTIVPCV